MQTILCNRRVESQLSQREWAAWLTCIILFHSMPWIEDSNHISIFACSVTAHLYTIIGMVSSIVVRSNKKECYAYSSLFAAKAKEAEAAGNIKAQAVFALLGEITFMMLEADAPEKPFAPAIVLPDRRSATLDDFSDEYLDTLREIASEILDPEMRARIADILWVKKRDFLMGRLAVDAYLGSASVLEHPETWSEGAHRIERAMRVAMALREGKRPVYVPKVIAHIEAVLDRYNGEDPSFLSAKMMELLQELMEKKLWKGDTTRFVALAEKAALRAEAEHDWWKALNYRIVKARWHELERDEDNKRLALVAVAEIHIKEAEDSIKPPNSSYLKACAHLEDAIKCYRNIPGMQKRVDELYKRLLEYQEKSMLEMKHLHVEIHSTQQEEEARQQATQAAKEAVAGKRIHEALFILANMPLSPDVDHLREAVEAINRVTPLQHLIAKLRKDNTGRVVGRKPETLSSTPDKSELFEYAVLYQQFNVITFIEPVREQINLEHDAQVDDLLPVVSHAPFVPPGRECIYARGLHAGLKGDLLVAAHLLVPQIEHSVRYMLSQRGIVTSRFNDRDLQMEFDLNTTLTKYHAELAAILGNNIVFDLQGLLVEKFGSNLRNLVAHGLLDYHDFSSQVLYLWWLTLHLILPVSDVITPQEPGKS